MKFKWMVQPLLKGIHRSSERRPWPIAVAECGEPIALIIGHDEYEPWRARSGQHHPLSIRVRFGTPPHLRHKHGRWTWRPLIGFDGKAATFKQLDWAKGEFAMFLRDNPGHDFGIDPVGDDSHGGNL